VTRTRRRRADEVGARDLEGTGKETAGERTLAGEAVRLQELLGNASATEVLARSAVQRDPAGAEAAPAKAGEKEEPKGVVYTITMSDIGTFELLSWSWGVGTAGSAESGGGGPGKQTVRDISASTHAGNTRRS
jgi:hypothetical protein